MDFLDQCQTRLISRLKAWRWEQHKAAIGHPFDENLNPLQTWWGPPPHTHILHLLVWLHVCCFTLSNPRFPLKHIPDYILCTDNKTTDTHTVILTLLFVLGSTDARSVTLGMSVSGCPSLSCSTNVIQKSQQLLVGLTWNIAQVFMVCNGWILLTSVTPCQLLGRCHKIAPHAQTTSELIHFYETLTFKGLVNVVADGECLWHLAFWYIDSVAEPVSDRNHSDLLFS